MAANSSHGLDDSVDQEHTDTRSEIQLPSMLEDSNGNDTRKEIHVNIDEMVSHIKRRLEAYIPAPLSYRVICKVPDKYHDINRDAYVPFSWSFGPYHRGKECLLYMEKHKPLLQMGILKIHLLRSYLEGIQSLEDEARKYYSEDIKLESKSFIEMLLLDGCCLLYTMIGPQLDGNGKPPSVEPDLKPEEIRPRQRLSFSLELYHDILLLENQIPFFILQDIYNVTKGGSMPPRKLESDLVEWLKDLTYPQLPGRIIKNDQYKIHHILHLLHLLVKPTDETHQPPQWFQGFFKLIAWFDKSESNSESHMPNWITKKLINFIEKVFLQTDRSFVDEQRVLGRWRRASEYHETGVTFKMKDMEKEHSLLDVEFRSGTLWIPFLEINDLTETIFRNLVALEVETAQHGYHVVSYMLFISDLLSMPEDVTLLSQKGIIVHNLGSDKEVSQLFKGIRRHAPSNMQIEPRMRDLYCRLEKHHGSQWNRWGAWLKHRHFRNPWLFLALLAASIILVFTVLQGVLAFISYEQELFMNKRSDGNRLQ